MHAKHLIPADSSKIVVLQHPNPPEPTRTRHVSKSTPAATTLATNHVAAATKHVATATNPVHRFRYAGNAWRIYKRTNSPDASWYLEFERDGQRYKTSLQTAARAHAEVEAKSYIDAFLARRRGDRSSLSGRARQQSYSTLGEVFRLVPSLPITANPRTRESYVWSLRWVLRLALDLPDDAAVDAISAEVLSKTTAATYFSRVMARAGELPTQADRNTWLRTATQIWASALALFAPLPLEVLRETHHLSLPDLDGFRKGRKLYLREKVAKATKFNRPDDATIRRTLVEWVKMGRTPGYTIPTAQRHGPKLSELDRRNVFIAAGLALSCGLRAGEFEQARWSWFSTDGGRPLLFSASAKAKNRTGEIRVRPIDPFWRVLNQTIDRNGWRTGDFCLDVRAKVSVPHVALQYAAGGDSDRTWWPRWLVGKWLRWLGWKTQKSNHALRDLAASYVTMKFGLHRAQLFCRHSDMKTTQNHYNQFVTEDDMDNPKALAWLKWAK